ncbi:MAG: macro domain-containing protein [Eggerthellaceae bacterium]|nr:macro domain-containing protein [Eggerthellaceae bacterium]
MPFTIERNDLAHVNVDAIVVSANEGLKINGGVGLSVARAAGLAEMQAACDALGGCPTGQAVATPAFALPAKYVVHVVGPMWQGGAQGEEAVLRQAYDSALACADECGARSIALPLISAHTFGCPVRLSFVIAVEAIKAFLEDHDDTEVRLVLFGDDAMAVGRSFYDNIAQYIDGHYVESVQPRNYSQNIPSRDEGPVLGPQFSERREQHWVEAAASKPKPQYAQPSTSSRPDYSRKEALPGAAKGRRGVFSRISDAVEDVRDRLSESRKPPKDKPQTGTCVVRDEREELLGPHLSAEQYWRIQDEAEEASWRTGVCPICNAPVEGKRYCPGCGRSVPPYALPSDTAGSFAPMDAPSQEAEFVFDVASAEFERDELPSILEDSSEDSYLDLDLGFASRREEKVPLETATVEEYAPPAPSAQQAAPSAVMQAASAQRPSGGSLKSWLDSLDAPFSTTLLALIDERGLTDAEVYKRANMSRQLFSKIRCDAGYRPTKKTVLALAIALGLDLGETVDLLQRAGFALSHSSKADVIVEYFIVNGNYDIFAVNEALYAFDQPLL